MGMVGAGVAPQARILSVDIPVVNPSDDLVQTQADLTRGTSQATALVAGAVALVRSNYPKMPGRQKAPDLAQRTLAGLLGR